jgi:hypothetical protein
MGGRHVPLLLEQDGRVPEERKGKKYLFNYS